MTQSRGDAESVIIKGENFHDLQQPVFSLQLSAASIIGLAVSVQLFVTYSVTSPEHDQIKRTREAIVPFELIMLLGFFGTALLALLPASPGKSAADNFRRGRRQRRGDRGQRAVASDRHRSVRAATQGGVRRVPGGWPAAAD
jgi:hypothetical protein